MELKDIESMDVEVQQKIAYKQMRRWQFHPEEFIEQVIGVHEGTPPGLHITSQQMDALKFIGILVEAKVLKF